MALWAFSLLAFIVAMCSAATEEDDRIATAVNDFSLDFYHQVEPETTNMFFSPYSVFLALSMVLTGTNSSTRQEVTEALHISDIDNYLESLKQFKNTLDNEQSYTLSVNNGVFPSTEMLLKQSYQDVVVDKFRAVVKRLDFANDIVGSIQYINNWISRATKGLINDLVDPESIGQATALVLINTIYFNSNWSVPFPGTPQSGTFRLSEDDLITVPMMTRTLHAATSTNTELSTRMLQLNYADEKASMYVILPDITTNVQEVQRRLTSGLLSDMLSKLKYSNVEVTMPKFEITYALDLVEHLQRMGINEMFSTAGDFSAMTPMPGIAITDVFHQAYVQVDEMGTEAAATTVVVATRSSSKADTKFHINRPFIFLIVNKDTGAILFMGQVINPKRTLMTRRAIQMSAGASHATPETCFIAMLFTAYLGYFLWS